MLPLNLVAELEAKGIVTRTFRRLDFDKQEALYRAALQVFAEEGFDGASMEKIAKKINTGGGALYRYVENKEKLFHFVAEVLLHQLSEKVENLEQKMMAKQGGENIVSRILKTGEWLAGQNKDEFTFSLKAIYEFGNNKTKEEFFHRYHRLLTKPIKAVLEQGRSKGEIKKDVDIELASALVLETIIKVQGAKIRPYLSNGIPGAKIKDGWEKEVGRLLFEGLKAK